MVLTIFGVIAVGFMMTMYALESRGSRYILAFALACLLSSGYGFLAGTWPFGIVEMLWSGVAIRRWMSLRALAGSNGANPLDRGSAE